MITQSSTAAVVIDEEAESKVPTPPTLLVQGPGHRLWYKMDKSFLKPRANVMIELVSPVISSSPQAEVRMHHILPSSLFYNQQSLLSWLWVGFVLSGVDVVILAAAAGRAERVCVRC